MRLGHYGRREQAKTRPSKPKKMRDYWHDGGKYIEPAHGPYYCAKCDYDFDSAEKLTHHIDLRHSEPMA